jgi:putative transcriptional regulator
MVCFHHHQEGMTMNTKKGKRNLIEQNRGESTVENEILEALSEFTDGLEKGDVCQRFNCRQIKLNLHRTAYSPDLVKKTRELLGVSQPLFARFIGASLNTVKAWEQGINPPHLMACRFMDEIRRNPKYWLAVLKKIAVSKKVHA